MHGNDSTLGMLSLNNTQHTYNSLIELFEFFMYIELNVEHIYNNSLTCISSFRTSNFIGKLETSFYVSKRSVFFIFFYFLIMISTNAI